MTWTPQPPIEVILAWPPKSAHPEIIGPAQYIVTGIFGSIAAVAVLFRLYTRAFTRRYFGIDDYLIIVAFVSCCSLMYIHLTSFPLIHLSYVLLVSRYASLWVRRVTLGTDISGTGTFP
jgi:hypothetical protein